MYFVFSSLTSSCNYIKTSYHEIFKIKISSKYDRDGTGGRGGVTANVTKNFIFLFLKQFISAHFKGFISHFSTHMQCFVALQIVIILFHILA